MKLNDDIRDVVKVWLGIADEDLGLAEYLVKHDSPYFMAIGFHCQQAAEKYLKAFLSYHQIKFRKTHNLKELLDLIKTIDESLTDTLSDAVSLNPYGVELRYPDDIPTLTKKEAGNALKIAKKIRDNIYTKLLDL